MADTLGSRIGNFRKQKGVTQDQLAERIGVSSQAVSKWENELSCPDITLLPQLADYFSVTIDELLRGKNSLAVQIISEGERKDFNKLLLKMRISSVSGDIIKINLPLSLIKIGLEIGNQIPQLSSNDTLKNVDFKSILFAAESGVIGKLLEIKSSSGDIVEIMIE